MNMKKIGIICEYNPFHSGHAYQMEQIRLREPDAAIVCLMSGHATQRGELAVADRYTRAAMALSCGADAVLELPYPFSAASAAYFAGAGVALLDALGMDELSFGSECADASHLERAASVTQSSAFISRVQERQRRGEGSAQAYFAELQDSLGGEERRLLANDILGVEYIRAIRAIGSNMTPMPIFRDGSAYSAFSTEQGRHPSATALRSLIQNGNINDALEFLPENAKKELEIAFETGLAPTDMSRLDRAILAFFRLHDPQHLEQIAEMQGGLSHRLHDAARRAVSLEEMLLLASSKSYPTARLRRAVLFAMSGVTAQDLSTPPAYLTLLAANQTGRDLLRQWKGKTPIPIVTKSADTPTDSAVALRQAALSCALDSLFALALPTTLRADTFVKISPRIK